MAIFFRNSFVGLRFIYGYETSWVCPVSRELCSLLKANQQGLHRRRQGHPNTMYCGWRCPHHKYRISRWVERVLWETDQPKKGFYMQKLSWPTGMLPENRNWKCELYHPEPSSSLASVVNAFRYPDLHPQLMPKSRFTRPPSRVWCGNAAPTGRCQIHPRCVISCLRASIAYSAPRCRCACQRVYPLNSWHP